MRAFPTPRLRGAAAARPRYSRSEMPGFKIVAVYTPGRVAARAMLMR